MMLVAEVTEWCASIMVTSKKGKYHIRLYVDLSRLNGYVKRERYQSPTPLEAIAGIAAEEATYFTDMDVVQPYHQLPLDVGSHTLTTFITTFGHFRYLTALYSLSSTADHCNYQVSEAF